MDFKAIFSCSEYGLRNSGNYAWGGARGELEEITDWLLKSEGDWTTTSPVRDRQCHEEFASNDREPVV